LSTPSGLSKSDDEDESQWGKLDDICIGESVSAEDMVAKRVREAEEKGDVEDLSED
jgi:hypothetical protein